MRVLITGIDGYLGWPLACSLASKGHEVGGIDNCTRRKCVREVGSQSALPIPPVDKRLGLFGKTFGQVTYYHCDLCDYSDVVDAYSQFQPDAIVYLGEVPSAPYSMKGQKHAIAVQSNNVIGTLNTLYAMKEVCPNAHLLKLGTMGEYGTPGVPIPEGFFPKGSRWDYPVTKDVWKDEGLVTPNRSYSVIEGMMFPRQAGSWYHLSKVHDTHNIEFACRNWGLRSTDVMQGVVYGTSLPFLRDQPELCTRFDFDECFGTVINRFCVQAITNLPLTVYGKGNQKRGFLPLCDSIQCLTLALENPPEEGEYRVFNQLDQVYSINQLAAEVAKAARGFGIGATIKSVPNPRKELESHSYRPEVKRLYDLGYSPQGDLQTELYHMIQELLPHRNRIEESRNCIAPTTQWA